jgi:hypothetical protein
MNASNIKMALFDHIKQLYQAELYEDLIHLVSTFSSITMMAMDIRD